MSQEHLVYALAHAAQKKAVSRRKQRKRVAAARIPPGQSDAIVTLSPTQKTGRKAEEQAKAYLQDAGLIVLQQNLRSKSGEIDLICRDQAILTFIEVRHRRSARYGSAAASVNLSKQRRLVKTAFYFLPWLTRCYFQGQTPPCRFDVVTIEPDGLKWIKNAFNAD